VFVVEGPVSEAAVQATRPSQAERTLRPGARGFRIELGDVEAAFMACLGVDFAVAVPRPHADFTNELVFVEADASVTRDDLFAWGRRLLAPYMVPREIELTTALPRTATVGPTARPSAGSCPPSVPSRESADDFGEDWASLARTHDEAQP
jgi:AMP-binding enzyme C-terminal domain